jgi:hypothetical protein
MHFTRYIFMFIGIGCGVAGATAEPFEPKASDAGASRPIGAIGLAG